jgi:hypothetical protein
LPTRRRAYREFVWCLTSGWEDFTLAAIRREERKLKKPLGKLHHQLNGVRAAAKALGRSAEREVVGVKKRALRQSSVRRLPGTRAEAAQLWQRR